MGSRGVHAPRPVHEACPTVDVVALGDELSIDDCRRLVRSIRIIDERDGYGRAEFLLKDALYKMARTSPLGGSSHVGCPVRTCLR